MPAIVTGPALYYRIRVHAVVETTDSTITPSLCSLQKPGSYNGSYLYYINFFFVQKRDQ